MRSLSDETKALIFLSTGLAIVTLAVGADSIEVEAAMGIVGLIIASPAVYYGRKEEKRRERKDRENRARYINREFRDI